jgi:hypothetical protein
LILSLHQGKESKKKYTYPQKYPQSIAVGHSPEGKIFIYFLCLDTKKVTGKIFDYFLCLDTKKVTKKNQDRHPSRAAPPF